MTWLLRTDLDGEGLSRSKSLLRKTMPAARRVLGESNEVTLKMRWNYALTLYIDPAATLDDLRESVETLQETAKTIRQVYGGAHPMAVGIDLALRESRAALRARDTAPSGSA